MTGARLGTTMMIMVSLRGLSADLWAAPDPSLVLSCHEAGSQDDGTSAFRHGLMLHNCHYKEGRLKRLSGDKRCGATSFTVL